MTKQGEIPVLLTKIYKYMKTYKVTWLDDEGNFINLGEYISNNPKKILFNKACEMLITAPYTFNSFGKNDMFWHNIQSGKNAKREFYFIEAEGILGTQVLSCIEVI